MEKKRKASIRGLTGRITHLETAIEKQLNDDFKVHEYLNDNPPDEYSPFYSARTSSTTSHSTTSPSSRRPTSKNARASTRAPKHNCSRTKPPKKNPWGTA